MGDSFSLHQSITASNLKKKKIIISDYEELPVVQDSKHRSDILYIFVKILLSECEGYKPLVIKSIRAACTYKECSEYYISLFVRNAGLPQNGRLTKKRFQLHRDKTDFSICYRTDELEEFI